VILPPLVFPGLGNGATTLEIMTLSIITLSKMKLSMATFSITTLNITALSSKHSAVASVALRALY